jgi:hypothetical protein
MSDNPLDSLPSFDRVSIRAVLVEEGEDPAAALAEAGFTEVISIPVVLGEAADPSGGILGDGITPNLVAVLETEPEDGSDPATGARSVPVRSASAAEPPPEPSTTNLPSAFGLQPLAPVRQRGVRQRGVRQRGS